VRGPGHRLALICLLETSMLLFLPRALFCPSVSFSLFSSLGNLLPGPPPNRRGLTSMLDGVFPNLSLMAFFLTYSVLLRRTWLFLLSRLTTRIRLFSTLARRRRILTRNHSSFSMAKDERLFFFRFCAFVSPLFLRDLLFLNGSRILTPGDRSPLPAFITLF